MNCKVLDTDNEKEHKQVLKGCSPILSEVDLAQVDLPLSLLFVCDPICFLRPELQSRVQGIMQIRELIWGWEKRMLSP